jgi:ribosome-binding protein aMBF1 (putative translation factor)
MMYRPPPGAANERVNAVAKKLSKKSIKEVRARFQREKPTAEQLVAAGDMEPPVSQATFLAVWQAVDALKKARLEAGLSLSQLASRAKLDKATLSRLEAGVHINPTIDTLSRYALALGRGVALSFPLPEQVKKDDRRRVLYG